MEPEAIVAEPEIVEKSEQEQISEATDRAFEKASEDKILGKETPISEAAKPKSEAEPADKGSNEKTPGDIDEQTLRDFREGKVIPKHRLDQVLERVKLYESFGSPEELARMLRARTAPEVKVSQPDKPAELNEEEKAAKDFFLKIFPELKGIPQAFEKFSEFQKDIETRNQIERDEIQVRHEGIVKAGTDEIKKMCEESGLSTDQENLELHLGSITQLMHKNKEFSDRFYREGDLKVLKTVFDDYFKRQFSGFQRNAKAKILQDGKATARLPRAPIKSGAAPADSPDKPAESFEEAGNRAWDKFNS